METSNLSASAPSTFILLGIPGLEAAHILISIPFSMSYIIGLLGNVTVLLVVGKEKTLHQPMYLLICMLALTDIATSTSVVPKALCIFWFNLKDITLVGCLTQIFFLHAVSVMQSAILVTMAFDRYVAICNPLRYVTILTNARIMKLGLLALIRATLIVLSLSVLLSRQPFCANHIIPHTYYDHMSVAKLSCGDITVNRMYGLVVPFVINFVDLTLIALSYSLIIRVVLKISSRKAHQKALSTCTTLICVMLTISHTYCEHMAVAKLSCGDITVNRMYGLVVVFVVLGLDVMLVALSYGLIARAIFRISSKKAHQKALNTCTAHNCVMLISCSFFLFSTITHRFGQDIAPYVHIILANLHFLLPPMLNPIIYGVKTKELRDGVGKYTCRSWSLRGH